MGLPKPDDRVIDGVDQLDWLSGQATSSRREGYVYWMGREMYGAKWRDFKLVLVEQRYLSDSAKPLPTPRLINLITDPQEREREDGGSGEGRLVEQLPNAEPHVAAEIGQHRPVPPKERTKPGPRSFPVLFAGTALSPSARILFQSDGISHS